MIRPIDYRRLFLFLQHSNFVFCDLLTTTLARHIPRSHDMHSNESFERRGSHIAARQWYEDFPKNSKIKGLL